MEITDIIKKSMLELPNKKVSIEGLTQQISSVDMMIYQELCFVGELVETTASDEDKFFNHMRLNKKRSVVTSFEEDIAEINGCLSIIETLVKTREYLAAMREEFN